MNETLNRWRKRLRNLLQVMQKNRFYLIGDLILTTAAVIISFALRFELGDSFQYYFSQAFWMIGIALIIKPIVYRKFGLYRRLWRYASVKEIRPIALAVTTASIFVSIVVVLLTRVQHTYFPLFYRGFPRSVFIIDWLLTIILIGGFRLSARLLMESQWIGNNNRAIEGPRRVLIIGAGDAGALTVREILKNQKMNLKPVGFLDDDPNKQEQQIHDIAVLGTLHDLGRVIDQHHIQEVIIAIPSVPGSVIRQVTDVCHQKHVRYRTMPSIYELIDGKVSVNRLREVEITDLLRRAPAKIDDFQIGLNLTGKRVLITGAGGSIGRELCRQIIHWKPSNLIMLGHGENSIFKIMIELQETYGIATSGSSDSINNPDLPLMPIIADVRDHDRIMRVFEKFRPQVVFHVAAHKHVPLMELNVEEAVTNNIMGTRNIAEIAQSFDVDRLVMISSDKSIRPSSVMGATKRFAEQVVLDVAKRTGRQFSIVRFGNVLGSRGSVIPHFKHQIAHGGPITITHPEMRRFFMTIPESVHLILQAMTLGKGGEVFVLRMGDQIRILDLAEDLIRLSGLEPYTDVDIVFTGIRPGEKYSEELWDSGANSEPTSHPDILRLTDQDFMDSDVLQNTIAEMAHMVHEGDSEAIMRLMDQSIPGSTVLGQSSSYQVEFES